MKKYLLTALLGVFGLFTAFASADTVGNFTSNSEICTYSFSDSSTVGVSSLSECGVSDNYSNGIFNFYACLDSEDSGFVFYGTINGNDGDYYTPTLPFCFSLDYGDVDLEFYNPNSDFENYDYIEENISGKIYYSTSPITYSSSSVGGDSDSSPLLSGGTTVFSGIISSLGSAVSEFIPYVAYIGIGLLGAIIGFVAIKRLINWIRAKVLGTFNSRRKR